MGPSMCTRVGAVRCRAEHVHAGRRGRIGTDGGGGDSWVEMAVVEMVEVEMVEVVTEGTTVQGVTAAVKR